MFKALVLEKTGRRSAPAVREVDEALLPEGDVLTCAVEYSTLNYKDAPGDHQPVAGGAQLADGARHRRRRHRDRQPPPGAGRPGDAVVLNGWGVGETHWGCLAAAGAPEGRLAGARCPAAFTRAPGHGHRHRRLHRHAVRAGAGAARRHARATARCW